MNLQTENDFCMNCAVKNLCVTYSLEKELPSDGVDVKVKSRLFRRGDYIFRQRSRFRSLFFVRSGSFKTFVIDEMGESQITGFYFPGDLIGASGFDGKEFQVSAQALETSSACEIPVIFFEKHSVGFNDVSIKLVYLMARELARFQRIFSTLSKTADDRLLLLLEELDSTLNVGGRTFSRSSLSVSKGDLANYMGLAPETISRSFSRMQRDGVINTQPRRGIVLNAV